MDPNKIISMTYSDDSDKTAGAILMDGMNYQGGTKDCLVLYDNKGFEFIELSNCHPLYHIDGKDINVNSDSKLRYINDLNSNITFKLYLTDTGNNRIVRLLKDFSQANTINASSPIDVCPTKSKYLFSLGSVGNEEGNGITLFAIDNAGATPLTSFGKFTTSNDELERVGKLKNPKSIAYITTKEADEVYGGLLILEQGINSKSRIQLIRSNKEDWLE
jgi:hypothetical protein